MPVSIWTFYSPIPQGVRRHLNDVDYVPNHFARYHIRFGSYTDCAQKKQVVFITEKLYFSVK